VSRRRASKAEPRLPYGPLERFLGPMIISHGHTVMETYGDQFVVGELLDVSNRTVTRWRAGTTIRLSHADTIACRLGVHPSAIWPDWFDVSAPEMADA